MSLLIQLPPGQSLPPELVAQVLAAASTAANAAARQAAHGRRRTAQFHESGADHCCDSES